MKQRWQIGYWCELFRSGTRYLVYRVDDTFAYGVNLHGGLTQFSHGSGDAIHLPDCTGWDWKRPGELIEPPAGYRLITEGEVVDGDRYLSPDGVWYLSTAYGESVEALIRAKLAIVYARKIEPQYRPFANAAEFKPFRDRWIKYKGRSAVSRADFYSNEGLFSLEGDYARLISWERAFDLLEFENEDGQLPRPFGVLV